MSSNTKTRAKEVEQDLETIEAEQQAGTLVKQRSRVFKRTIKKREELKQHLLQYHAAEIEPFSKEELEIFVCELADQELRVEDADRLSTSIGEKVNFNPLDGHWLAGKAWDFVATAGAVVVGGIVASQLSSAFGSGQPDSETREAESPFSDITATPRPSGRRGSGNVVPFDSKAG